MGASLASGAEIGITTRSPDDWHDALQLLFDSRAVAKSMGMAGRRLAEEKYSVLGNSLRLAEIFREAAA